MTATAIDLSPIINDLIVGILSLLGAVLTALGAYAIAWVRSKTALVDAKTADAAQQIFSEQVARMMAFAETVAKDHIPHGGIVDVNNPFLEAAVEYGRQMYPDTVGKLDWNAIAKAVVARIPSGPLTEKAEQITLSKAAPPAA